MLFSFLIAYNLNIHYFKHKLNNVVNKKFIILVKIRSFKAMRAQLLYWFHNELSARSIPCEHRHPYWQLEILVSGLLRIGTIKKLREFKAPSLVLISPETLHAVQKNSGEGEAFSFKFQANEYQQNALGVFVAPNDYFGGWLYDTVIDLCRDEKQNSELFINKAHVLEHLLAALMEHVGRCLPGTLPTEPELFTRLREFVLMAGRAANIETASEYLKCSPAHLKYMFRRISREHPELDAGGSVKDFIDRVCVELIEKHLRYSKMSVGEIAEAVNFPDIYKLSRFYRRMRKMAPSEFRKNLVVHFTFEAKRSK